MSLQFNISSLVEFTQNVSYDADASATGTLPDDVNPVDFVVNVRVNGLIQGNYVQNSLDVNDVITNISINTSKLDEGTFYVPIKSTFGGTKSTYEVGEDPAQLANGYQYGSSNTNFLFNDVNKESVSSLHTLINYQNYNSNGYFVDLGGGKRQLKSGRNRSGLGAVIVNAASAALFKKFGKGSAIINDVDMYGSSRINVLKNEILSTINSAVSVSNADYANSSVFRTYLYSGKYKSDIGDSTQVQTMNLDGAVTRVLVKMSGTASDPDDDINTAEREVIFGNYANGETKLLAANGNYEINFVLQIIQDDVNA